MSVLTLHSYTVPVDWFQGAIGKDADLDAEHIVEANVVAGLSRVEVYDSGQMVAIYDASDPVNVRVLCPPPLAATYRLAAYTLENS